MMGNVENEKRDNENYSKNFTRIPNVVFASYKHLSKEEKYLYSVLRFIYWDTKPRYVTLRELSELTGFSIGALSKMLPRLHTCGLIHAEIRREKGKNGQEKGNPKYHITILDIWEENRKFFSCLPKEQDAMDPSLILRKKEQSCSPNEQELLDPSQKLVHQMTQACSPNDTGLFTKSDKLVHEKEQGRAQPELAKKDIKTSLKKNVKRESSAQSSTPKEKTSPSLSSSSLLKDLSPEEISLMDLWDEMCGFKCPRDKKHVEAAKELVRCGAAREDLIAARDFCYQSNPDWYNKNGVDLAAIVRNWGKWKATAQRAANKPTMLGNYRVVEPGEPGTMPHFDVEHFRRGRKLSPMMQRNREMEAKYTKKPAFTPEYQYLQDQIIQSYIQLGCSEEEAREEAQANVRAIGRYGTREVSNDVVDTMIVSLMEEVNSQWSHDPQCEKAQDCFTNGLLKYMTEKKQKA